MTILCEVGTCEQAVSLLSDKLVVVILHADLELRCLFYCKCLVGDSIHLFGYVRIISFDYKNPPKNLYLLSVDVVW